MKNTKTFKVVTLTSNQRSSWSKIFLNTDNTLQLYKNEVKSGDLGNSQHLFIISDEEIKEGDNIYDSNFNHITKFKGESETYLRNNCKKIIASTDKSLGLSLIHDSFLSPFVNAYNSGNLITEIDLEMEMHYSKESHDLFLDTQNKDDLEYILKVKTRPDNTVIIRQSKTYTTQQVEELLKKQRMLSASVFINNQPGTLKWIKQTIENSIIQF